VVLWALLVLFVQLFTLQVSVARSFTKLARVTGNGSPWQRHGSSWQRVRSARQRLRWQPIPVPVWRAWRWSEERLPATTALWVSSGSAGWRMPTR